MVDIDAAFPSKYLKASDLEDRQVRARISHVDMESMSDGDGPKPILYFSKSEFTEAATKKKGLVLNKTNAKTIKTAYGKNTDDWENKEVVLFVALVEFKGDQVEGIRVRVPQAKKSAAPPPKQTENPGEGFDEDIADTF